MVIKLEAATRLLASSSDTDLVDVENAFFRFDLMQSSFIVKARKSVGYQHDLQITKALIKHLGFAKALAVWRAVQTYTTSSYGRLNKTLRSDGTPGKASLIDDYIKFAPKIKTNICYRGVGKDFWQSLAPGKTFVDKAFMSTTDNLETATHFAERTGKGGVMTIKGVAGIGAPIPFFGNEDNFTEGEILLPRGLEFKVVSLEDRSAHISLN